MDRFHEMTIFLAVANSRSLTAAARQLASSTPTITRAITALESRLATPLLRRSTRGILLTPAGERFALDCQRLLTAVSDAETSASGTHVQPRGRLRMAAPTQFGQHVMMPIVLDFMAMYPEVQIEACFMDREPHLHEDDIDVGVFMGMLLDSSHVALRVGSLRRVVVASPAYLAQFGSPDHPQALRDHRLLHSLADARLPEWQFEDNGEPLRFRFHPRLCTTTDQAALHAACLGAGVARCMRYQAEPACRRGDLIGVLETFEPQGLPLHLVYRDGRKAARRVRCFVDFVVERLRANAPT